MNATCRLVWLQYWSLLGKDSFFAGGSSWQCISLVIHQGRDPLYGDHQPTEHFYVLESEGPKCKSLCYNNAVGLHYIDDTKIKDGDRICGLFYRTTDITTKWSGQCTYTTKKTKTCSPQKLEKNKRNRSNRGLRILLCSRKRRAPKKHALQNPVSSRIQHAQDFSAPENYEPPSDDVTTIPIETIQIIEDAISQSQGVPEAAPSIQQEGSDPSHCPSLVLRANQAQPSSSARYGPYSAGSNDSSAVNDKTKPALKSPTAAAAQKPPYAILSMFDGCGSSVDIIEAKMGYRPKACMLCEKDETLRYLVGEKHGISVDHKWQHSSKGGGAFYYANHVDHLFVDNARLLRDFVALGADCHFFVIGGSPCTDLTYAGGDHGQLGICGPASVFFFTMHLALYLLTMVIPGNRIRFFVENVGSMRTEHVRFTRACLGLQRLQMREGLLSGSTP